MIFRNKDGSIYKVDIEVGGNIPVLADSDILKPLEIKVDVLKQAILEMEQVINYLLNKL